MTVASPRGFTAARGPEPDRCEARSKGYLGQRGSAVPASRPAQGSAVPPSSPARGKPQTRNCRNPRRGPGIPGKGRFFPVAPGAVALAIVVTVTVPVESSVPLGVTEPGETLQAASRGAPEQVARTCVFEVRGSDCGLTIERVRLVATTSVLLVVGFSGFPTTNPRRIKRPIRRGYRLPQKAADLNAGGPRLYLPQRW